MKNIFKRASILIAVTFLVSCSDNYFDVNTPGNVIPAEQVELKDIIGPSILYTVNAQYSAATNISMVDQHLCFFNSDQNIDRHYLNTLDGLWTNVYEKALPNIKVMEDKATESNSSHYKGIALILKAINFGLATDVYGDVPYVQATQGGNFQYPTYDSQQFIYSEIDKLFDSGIALLSAPNTSSIKPGTEDLIYGGDTSKWIKAAYTFKARYQLHLSKVNGAAAYTSVLASLAKGMTSNTDDFQLKYNAIQLNPWHSNQLGLNTGNLSYFISKQFISYMNGVAGVVFPFTTVIMDPRMPLLVDLRTYPLKATNVNPDPTVAANYKGGVNGTGGAGANAKIGTESFYSKPDSPIIILSYSEAKFMEAEANFILNGGNPTSVGTSAAAYAAYTAGISANLDKVGVVASAKTAFLADTSINKGAAALELKDIMRQKFIALYLNPETFSDYRRFDFSTNAFKGLALPTGTDPLNGGKWIRRFVYSTNEKNNNVTVYTANFKPMIAPVWWDK